MQIEFIDVKGTYYTKKQRETERRKIKEIIKKGKNEIKKTCKIMIYNEEKK